MSTDVLGFSHVKPFLHNFGLTILATSSKELTKQCTEYKNLIAVVVGLTH